MSPGASLEGEATAGGGAPDDGTAASLQLALSMAGGGTASLALPFLEVASRETPTMGGAAPELSPLADVPEALSLGLSPGLSANSAPHTAGGRNGLEEAVARAGGSQRLGMAERSVASGQAPQLQTQLGGEEAEPVTCNETDGVPADAFETAAPDAAAALDAVLDRPIAQTPAAELGPMLHTQLGGPEAGAGQCHAEGAVEAPVTNTQSAAAGPVVLPASLPASRNAAGECCPATAATRDGAETTLPRDGFQYVGKSSPSAAGGDQSAGRERSGRSSSIAGSGSLQVDVCVMDAPTYASPCLANAAQTQLGDAAKVASTDAAAAVPTGHDRTSEGAYVRAGFRLASHTASLPAPESGGMNRALSGPSDVLASVDAGPDPDSMGDKTTDVSSSPDKRPHNCSLPNPQAAGSGAVCAASPPANVDAVHHDGSNGAAADDAGPAASPAPAVRLAAEGHSREGGQAKDGAEGQNAWWAGGWEATPAESAGGDGDNGVANVPDSQPAGGGARECVQPRSSSVALRQVMRPRYRGLSGQCPLARTSRCCTTCCIGFFGVFAQS